MQIYRSPAGQPRLISLALLTTIHQMLTIPRCTQSLSRAYVTVVVGRARPSISWRHEFDYGVDGMVRELAARGPRIRAVNRDPVISSG